MPNIEKINGDALLRASFNAMSEGMAWHRIVYNSDGVAIDYLILDVNPAFENQTGLSKGAVIGKLATTVYGVKSAPFLEIYSRVATKQQPEKFEQYFLPLQRHFLVNVFSPEKDLFVTIFEDVSELKISEERWQFALEGAGDGVWDWNIQTGEATFSKRYKEMLGYAENEIGNAASEWSDRVHPEDMPRTMAAIQAHLDGKTPSILDEYRMRCKDGSWKWILGRGMLMSKSSDGKPLRLIGTNADITERKIAEESLRITASVFNNIQEGILITDANNNIVDVNQGFTRITKYSREDVIGKNPKMLGSGRQSKSFYERLWKSLGDEKYWRGEIWNRRKSGELYAELLSISSICDANGKAQRYVAVFSDISSIKEHEAALTHSANYDALTGIPNRLLLADRMDQAIFQATRDGSIMAVCYLDLDGFKPINDTMGHKAGDAVLIEVAKRIENTVRGGDTVARLGGDEFVLLLLGLNQDGECLTTIERLLAAISEPINVNNTTCKLSASIGVSMYPRDDDNPDTLLRYADQAMYVAKNSGKNRFHLFDQISKVNKS